MMSTHRVITRRKPGVRVGPKDFSFTSEMIDVLSPNWSGPEYLREYRQRSWQMYKTLPMPTTKDEPWRRTDIHALDVGNFSIPHGKTMEKLPGPPKWLLKPLISNKHGGQMIIYPDHTEISLERGYNKVNIF